MKKIKYLIWHCSATPESKDYTEAEIRNWFTSRGWDNPGYRDITHLDGSILNLQEHNQNEFIDNFEMTNGAKGLNQEAIHLAYIGGVSRYNPKESKDTRTNEQYYSMEAQTKYYMYKYPWIKILGHNQVARKACPSFYVPDFCRDICIPERNIFTGDLEVPLNFRTIPFDKTYRRGPSELFDLDHTKKLLT